MDTSNVFGEVLESTATAAKQTGKAAANAVGGAAQAAASQVGVPVADSSGNTAQNVSTQDVVESLYGKPQTQSTTPVKPQAPASVSSDSSAKTPEEAAQLEVVRKELHAAYYQSLTNPSKQQEERASEKVEREEKEEKMDLQQKEMEKPPPIAQQRAAQRVEKFPGASG